MHFLKLDLMKQQHETFTYISVFRLTLKHVDLIFEDMDPSKNNTSRDIEERHT